MSALVERIIAARDGLRGLNISDYALIRVAREALADAANALASSGRVEEGSGADVATLDQWANKYITTLRAAGFTEIAAYLVELRERVEFEQKRVGRWRGIAGAMGYEPMAHLDVLPKAPWLLKRIAMFRARVSDPPQPEPSANVAPPEALGEELFAVLGPKPIPMVLRCPACGFQHIDAADEAAIADYDPLDGGAAPWTNPPHRSHLCGSCGHIWRPADVPTEGVAAIATKGKSDSPIPPTKGEGEANEYVYDENGEWADDLQALQPKTLSPTEGAK